MSMMDQPPILFMTPTEPPEGEGWRPKVYWWRACECACGYGAQEYWNASGSYTVVCTKCGYGRKVPDGTSLNAELDRIQRLAPSTEEGA